MCDNVTGSRSSSEEASDASAKRPKQCKAMGCTVDLGILNQPYLYKRGLCRTHIQAESIELKGKAEGSLWRFCQQCNKIEPLSLFQGKKRSCHIALQKRRENDRKPKLKPVHRSVLEAVQCAQGAAAAATMIVLPEYNQVVTYSPDSTCTLQPEGPQCPDPGALRPVLQVATPAAACVPLTVYEPATISNIAEQDAASNTACWLVDLSAMLDDSKFDGELEQLIEQELQAVGGALLPEPTAAEAAGCVPAGLASANLQLQEIELQLLADIEAATRVATSTWYPAAASAPAVPFQLGMVSHPSGQFSCPMQYVAGGAAGGYTEPAGAAATGALLDKLQELAEEFASLKQQLELVAQRSQLPTGALLQQQHQQQVLAQQLYSASSMSAYYM